MKKELSGDDDEHDRYNRSSVMKYKSFKKNIL